MRLPTLVLAATLAAPAACADAQSTALPAWQAELLETAWSAASAFPDVPHRKNRARAQETVVHASLDLGAFALAVAQADAIDNWRRGSALGACAFRLAVAGRDAEARAALAGAREVAAWPADEFGQSWRRDQVVDAVVASEAWLDSGAVAAAARRGGWAPETPAPASVAAALAEEGDARSLLDALDAAIVGGSLEQVMAAVDQCLVLYGRFHGDPELRDAADAAVRGAEGRVPLRYYVETVMRMAEVDLHGASAESALARLDHALGLLREGRWLPEDEVPLRARAARLRHDAGRPEEARAEADAARELFDMHVGAIVDIWRAGALLPLAEAYAAMGDLETARAVYLRAAEEGARNPNARPRANDLVAICCSLARQGVQPDAALAARIAATRDGLTDPW